MNKYIPRKLQDLIIPAFVACFNVLIILFPKEVISASKEGLDLWWSNVLPALLPFIIGINILTGLGVVSFLGTLLEPLTYTLFGVPGSGGFALITGMSSGYPMGAKVTAMLREKKELSRTEAQRLISFSNNSGPLFVIGAVGVGMLGSEKAGYFILGIHYLSAIITGLLFKHYNAFEKKAAAPGKKILRKAFHTMQIKRAKDGRSFGVLMGDAVKDAMETIAQIGGYIILFSVLVKVVDITGIIEFPVKFLLNTPLFSGMGEGLVKGFFFGTIEITNGAKIISNVDLSNMGIVLCCAIISFGGFSIHAQAFNYISKTDIKFGLYLFSKLIQACLAAVSASLIIPFFSLHATSENLNEKAVEAFGYYQNGFIGKIAFSTLLFGVSVLFIAIAVLFANLKAISKRNKL